MEKALSCTIEGIPTIWALATFPDDFDPQKEQLPLIVFLHGSGESGDRKEDLGRLHNTALPVLFSKDPCYQGVRCLTLSPQCHDNELWDQYTFVVMKMIRQFAEENHVNKNRISLTGISMGGFGTWYMAQVNPTFFSCIAPICGGGAVWKCEDLARVKMPVRVIHGDLDESVPFTASVWMVEELKRWNAPVQFDICEGYHHNCWDHAYQETDLIQWLVSQDKTKQK